MLIKKTGLCFLGIVCFCGMAFAEMRTWTSVKGETIEAEYVCSIAGHKVLLKTSDGRDLKIPVDKLSAKDQEYLAATIPPEIDIHVDVDIDRNKECELNGYARKRETVKCSVSIKKTSKGQCSRDFTAYIYVLAEKVNDDVHWVMSCNKQEFSFMNGSNVFCFKSSPSSVEYTDRSYSNDTGFKYEGYLVVVEDSSGSIIATESTREVYEKNWGKIRGGRKGTRFDRDFDSWDGQYISW